MNRICHIEIDEKGLARPTPEIEQERRVAIFDLLEANYFYPEGAEGGPYDLRMGLMENRLVLDVRGPD